MNAQPPHQPYQQAPNPYAAPINPQPGPMGFGAGYGMEQQQPLASLGARFAGSLVDGLVYGVALIPAIAIAASSGGQPDEALLIGGVALPFLIIAIVQIYLISTSGQSIGKKLLGTKIIKMDGGEAGFVHGVLLRSWLMGVLTNIPIAGMFIAIIDPLLIFGDERRCLHDKIAGTQVIEVR